MRYHNPKSGLTVLLDDLDAERKSFYRAALAKYQENVSWFAFEQFAFAFDCPIFRNSRNRKEVLNDPLYMALKDMWLWLGVRQGLVAEPKRVAHESAAEKTRASGTNRAAGRGHMEIADQPRRSARRGRRR
jgi:hypothetical protein